ncbi:MAG: oligosaccharide flippase family protein [Candidatus Neomarinimicrobiota bacterium]|nr:oligosaccharide flippase family protein [Candidatus Neomarinimicrobiota bacterium]
MLNKHLLKNSLYTGVALLFVGFVPFIFNILVARTFGKEILGSVNVALSFCLVLTVFVTNFFGTSGNKFLAEYRGRQSLEPFKLIFFSLLIGPVVVLSFMNIAMVWYWDYLALKFSIQSNFLIPMVCYIYFRSLYIIFRRMFYGVDLVSTYAINEIVSDIVLIATIVTVCWLRLPNLLIQSYVFGYAIFTVISIFVLYRNYTRIVQPLQPQVNYQTKSILIGYFKYGFITMAGTASSTGTGYLSMLFTGYFLTSTDAGLYSSVLAVVSILMFLPRLVTQVLLPEFSKLFGAGEKILITQTLKYSFWLLVVIALIVNGFLFVFAEEILSIFGNSFSNGSLILRVMIPGVFIRMISVPLVTFLSATEYVIYPNIGGIIILIVSVVTWFIAVPAYDLTGIAAGYVAGISIGIGYQIVMAVIILRSFSSKH